MKIKILFLTMFCIFNCFLVADDFYSLSFEYKNDEIIISTNDKSFYTKIENTYDGMYQISKDRNRMIVFTESDYEAPYYCTIYYIDSKKRQKSFVMKNWKNAMSDVNIDFIFCQNDKKNPFTFILYDIKQNKPDTILLKVDNPQIIEKSSVTVQIYRSLDLRYDFIIDLSVDAYTAAEYGFCIKDKKFTKIFDQTLGNESSYKILDERTDFEVGW